MREGKQSVNLASINLTAEGDVIAQMLEDFRLAADFDRTHAALDRSRVVLLDQTHAALLDRTYLDRAREAGPVPFLRGFRRGEANGTHFERQGASRRCDGVEFPSKEPAASALPLSRRMTK